MAQSQLCRWPWLSIAAPSCPDGQGHRWTLGRGAGNAGLGPHCDSAATTGFISLSRLASLHGAGRVAHSKGLGSRGTPPAWGHEGVRPRLPSPFLGHRHWLRAARTRQKPAVMSHSDVTQRCHTMTLPVSDEGGRAWEPGFGIAPRITIQILLQLYTTLCPSQLHFKQLQCQQLLVLSSSLCRL